MAQLLQNKVRALVSKKKHRMREDGFDLDLTYVTPRIIAMGIPSVDYQKMYRNRIEDVERFWRRGTPQITKSTTSALKHAIRTP